MTLLMIWLKFGVFSLFDITYLIPWGEDKDI